MTRRERRYHQEKKRHREFLNETSEGWCCSCGHYEESDYHCSLCGNEPPWGCDCSFCNDRFRDKEDVFDQHFGEDFLDSFY